MTGLGGLKEGGGRALIAWRHGVFCGGLSKDPVFYPKRWKGSG